MKRNINGILFPSIMVEGTVVNRIYNLAFKLRDHIQGIYEEIYERIRDRMYKERIRDRMYKPASSEEKSKLTRVIKD